MTSFPKINLTDIIPYQVYKFSDIFDSIGFVKLETRDDALIGRIDRIIAVDNKYVILDGSISKAVFVFDGKVLNRIGRNGRGPREYESPN